MHDQPCNQHLESRLSVMTCASVLSRGGVEVPPAGCRSCLTTTSEDCGLRPVTVNAGPAVLAAGARHKRLYENVSRAARCFAELSRYESVPTHDACLSASAGGATRHCGGWS